MTNVLLCRQNLNGLISCDIYIGEALGLLSALEWVDELNFGYVDFKLDSKKVVDSFMSRKHDVSEFGAISNHCRAL